MRADFQERGSLFAVTSVCRSVGKRGAAARFTGRRFDVGWRIEKCRTRPQCLANHPCHGVSVQTRRNAPQAVPGRCSGAITRPKYHRRVWGLRLSARTTRSRDSSSLRGSATWMTACIISRSLLVRNDARVLDDPQCSAGTLETTDQEGFIQTPFPADAAPRSLGRFFGAATSFWLRNPQCKGKS